MIFSTNKTRTFRNTLAISLILIFSQNSFANDKNSENMGSGMMGSGTMGRGMMGSGMMGMCPSSSLENVKTSVIQTSDGATITYTAKNKKDIARIHKIAQMTKLAHELNEEEVQNK